MEPLAPSILAPHAAVETGADARVDLLVVGAGPVGLACAIESKRAGLTARVIEKEALVNSLVGYPARMEFFSTPDLLEIGGHPFPTAGYKPVREEALDYYRRVAHAERLDLRLYERVRSVRGQAGTFEIETNLGTHRAEAVVVSTGFFDQPNRLGVPGDDLPHVAHYYREPYACVGRPVVVIGAKNSAAKAALSLFRAGAEVTLVARGPDVGPTVKYWIRPDLMNRIAEGSIGALFGTRIAAIRPGQVDVLTPDGPQTLRADFVFALTGYRPDFAFLDALGVATEGDRRVPVYDEETMETNRAGVYLAGTVCGGLDTSRWFIENGRHHAALIAAHLASQLAR